MKIKLIRERNTYIFRVFSLIAVVLIFVFLLTQNNLAIMVAPFFQLLSLFVASTYLYKNIGNIELSNNQITINEKLKEKMVYQLSEIIKLNVIYDSKRINKKFVFVKGFLIRVQIEALNEIFEYKIILDRRQRNEFINQLRVLYKNGVSIRERDELGAKMFLLQGNLSYKEIQEIKEQYKICW